jgi:hypothetical protein
LKAAAQAGRAGKYQVLLTNRPVAVSYQYAASAMRPTGMMALRSLDAIPITRLPRPASFSSSPRVLTSRRCGDAPAPAPPPRIWTDGSKTLVTRLPLSRSYQSLATIPDRAGMAPESMVEWPTAVTVG